ncbi:MAG: hypothetical protein MZV64_10835 [Ignavibacteriales bacterium]|nr:hypothetical protein [Ignavibacteriales bacterium]
MIRVTSWSSRRAWTRPHRARPRSRRRGRASGWTTATRGLIRVPPFPARRPARPGARSSAGRRGTPFLRRRGGGTRPPRRRRGRRPPRPRRPGRARRTRQPGREEGQGGDDAGEAFLPDEAEADPAGRERGRQEEER